MIPPGSVPAVDAHLFTPDGKEILFSAVNFQAAPARSWLDRLLGVQVATAHNVPSDWYRVSLAGGEPQRLTELGDTGLFGAISPGGDRLAFIGSTGLYMMNLDGSDLWKVADLVAVGTLDWIP